MKDKTKRIFEKAWRGLAGLVKRNLVAGAVTLFPVSITVMTFKWGIEMVDKTTGWLPLGVRDLFIWDIPGSGFLIVFATLLATGVFARNVFGRKLIEWLERATMKLPVLGKIYDAVKKVGAAATGKKDFKEAVMIRMFGVWTLGWVTSECTDEIKSELGEDAVNVYVPTTPNPTSGYLVFARRSELKTLAMSADDAIQLLISGGIVSPAGICPNRKPIDKTGGND